ncbi:hypothetical protein QAD02_023213 [Eretmocerus hayati]|uniref:Uncharacterized protein n=1 Tax=Eretmocerus hayati TaxID=131215 RepID=A0ACC2PVV2_9HYME|nr:hypothetical protein QAD02_023213 [Eretmocerus hayati]
MQLLGVSHLLLVIVLINILCNAAYADVNIVPRSEWQAKQPRHEPINLTTIPPNWVVISHTELTRGGGYCETKKECYPLLRNLQIFHRDQQGLNDIVYNFLVGGDGTVYEGRGWDIEGQHTKGYDSKSLGIAFIGDFESKSPREEQVNGVKNFLEYAVSQNKLTKDYKLIGQNQVPDEHTNSPGSKVSKIIKTWEHWTEV